MPEPRGGWWSLVLTFIYAMSQVESNMYGLSYGMSSARPGGLGHELVRVRPERFDTTRGLRQTGSGKHRRVEMAWLASRTTGNMHLLSPHCQLRPVQSPNPTILQLTRVRHWKTNHQFRLPQINYHQYSSVTRWKERKKQLWTWPFWNGPPVILEWPFSQTNPIPFSPTCILCMCITKIFIHMRTKVGILV